MLWIVVPTGAQAQGALPTAGCAPGEATAELDVAGVRATLYSEGNLFWNASGGGYEVPKGSQIQAIFSTSLMVGGLVDGDLRFAGSTYGPWEFWPGPLDADGTATPGTCAAYDRIWVVATDDVAAFDDSGVATDDLATWPIAVGAPFYVDDDDDGRQSDGEPTVSLDPDDPGYGTRTIDLGSGERPVVFGRQTAWWVMNDLGGAHEWSETSPLGIEVRATAWVHGGESAPGLSQSTFYRFEIVNRSATTIEDVRAGLYVDSDLGDATDDRVGTDSTRQMLVFYNGDDFDDGGYGETPPALGIDLLSGASGALAPIKSTQWGEPSNGVEGDRYLQGVWKDGTPLTYGGFGLDSTARRTRWAYPGDVVTRSYWSQENIDGAGTSLTPSDKRGVISTEPTDLAPGGRLTMDAGVLFAAGLSRLNSVEKLREVSDVAQSLYIAGALTQSVPAPPPPEAPTLLSPNDGESVDRSDPAFAWTPVPGAENYVLEFADSPDASTPVFSRHVLTGTSVTIEREAFPTNRRRPLYWRVRSVRLGEESSSEARAVSVFTPAVSRFGIVANGAGPLDPPIYSTSGFFGDADRQQTNGVSWWLAFDGDLRGDAASRAYPNDYEIRFVVDPSDPSYALRASDGLRLTVPFELWDTGVGTPDEPADDVRLIPVVEDEEGGWRFDLGITWFRPSDTSPGERGYRRWTDDPEARTLPDSTQRVLPALTLGIQDVPDGIARPGRPEPGTVFRIESSAQALAVAEPETPGTLVLEVRPNPTGDRSTVGYRLPDAATVRLRVVDMLGRVVDVLAEGGRDAGEHHAALDAGALARGVYVVVLEAGDQRAVQTITVAR